MIKKRTIIILVLLIALLAASFYFVNKKESKSNIVGLDDVEKPIELYKADSDAVSSITVITADDGYKIYKNRDGEWRFSNKEDVPVDDVKADSLAVEVTAINAYQLIDKAPSDLKKYGLHVPKYSFTVTVDGKSKTFYRGDPTPVGDYYYFMDSQSNKVYSIYATKCNSIFKDSSEYMSDAVVNIDTDSINYIELTNDYGKFVIKKSSDDSKNSNGYTNSSWNMTEPVQARVDEQKLKTEIIDKIAALTSKKYMIGRTYEDYGLQHPQATLTVNDAGGKPQTILLGNGDNEGYRYLAVEGTKTIIRLDKIDAEFFDLDCFYLISKYISLMNFDEVSKVDIQSTDANYELVTYQNGKDAFLLNGKKIKEKTFRTDIFQKVIGLSADDYCSDATKSTPAVSIIYTLRNGGQKNVEYVEYDNKYYAAFVDGQCSFKIKKSSVNNMLKAVGTYVK